MIYCDYIILDQIISLRNSPENLDEAIENDKTKTLVKMFVPIYNNTTGQFLGVKETLRYIMLRNEPQESFFTYGYSPEHLGILFCFSKQVMSFAFQSKRGTSFNSHKLETFVENNSDKSDVFSIFHLSWIERNP